MSQWISAVGFFFILAAASAQSPAPAATPPPSTTHAPSVDLNQADRLYRTGKRLEALPLYEELTRQFPQERMYWTRLADCLGAKSSQSTDPAVYIPLRTHAIDAAKRAVALGEDWPMILTLAKSDPSKPQFDGLESPGKALLTEAEKSYSAGDYATALRKYTEAAEADPRLYEAALFAGDTAYVQHDLPTASKWFARAIAIDPDRETAYRYWGDAIWVLGNDPEKAREKFLDAVVAEPYNRMAWQGLKQWANKQQAALLAPQIERPAPPVRDPKKPNNITINLDPAMIDDKKHPGTSAWMMYSMSRSLFQSETFAKQFPNEKNYRHTLKEEDDALNTVLESLKGQKINPKKLDESLRNLVELGNAGMLDCWILFHAADEGIAQDYPAYRAEHRQLLHDYLARYVVHGGKLSAQ